MAFPTVSARTSTLGTTAATAHAISLGSPSAGELLVVVANVVGNPTITIDRSVSGYDWWQVGTGDGSTSERVAVFAKIATGSDALTLQLDASQRLAALTYRISGHGSTVAIGAFGTASGTNGDPASVTQSGSAQDTLFLACLATVSSVASAAPSGYATLTTASATSIFLSMAEKTANATSDDPGTFTNTSQRYVTVTLAIGSTAIATDARVTQAAVETVSDSTPDMRVTQMAVEVVSANALNTILTQMAVEMVSTNVPDDVLGGRNQIIVAG